ncbi:MAG: phenylalanine--tRNA ligase subunit beta [Acidobacteria bacterium]|nr:phenylalanine--tRNA ligase subunit beta [Acidobacteriota bacterium]
MEFSISWLADYVDLSPLDGLQVGSGDRHAFGSLTEATRTALFQIGEKLTQVGLAVEAYPITMVEGRDGLDEKEASLDVEVTSNRPDCMCHLGLARELAATLGRELRRPKVPTYGASATDGTAGSVVVEDPEGCTRYVARVIRGVKVGPSPDWLVRRLASIGQRSINNVVDATNFVLWELGQPLHAFDLATIPGGEIHVRRARAGERLTTLDGEERELDPEVLVIADRERAVALAGIMGGLDTEVTADSTDLLLESAHFDRRRVRIGARRLGMHTDASHRFERGSDPEVCDLASSRCAALIVEIAGGSVEEPAIDAVARPHRRVAWRLDKPALDRFAGVEVPAADIERILGALELEPRAVAEGVWEGEVPGFREADFDPRRTPPAGRPELDAYPQDVYEEVLRHWGLANVPSTLPKLTGVDAGKSPAWHRRWRAKDVLVGFGLAEGVHFAFHAEEGDRALPALGDGAPVRLANPLSERYAVLRRSLVPNLLSAAEYNLNRGATAVGLFESGSLFPGVGEREVEGLAMIVGGRPGTPWDRRGELDLFDLKGYVEALLAELGATPRFEPADELPGILAGTGAWILQGAGRVGWLGRVEHAEGGPALFAAEVWLDELPAEGGRAAVEPPARFPGIEVDLTLTHSLEVAWREVAEAIEEAREGELAGFELKDRYQGKGVPAGAVATTIAFRYQAEDRSLAQEEVNQWHARLAAELERRFGIAREGER